jgi:O-antigen/teichoic acid export membrane protein
MLQNQVIISLIIYGAVFILEMVRVKLLSNILSVEDYGYYSLIFNSVSYISQIILLATDRYIVKKSAEVGGVEARTTLNSILIWYFVSSIIFIPIILFSNILPFNPWLITSATIFFGITNIYRFFLLGLGAGRSYSFLNLIILHGWLPLLLVSIIIIEVDIQLILNLMTFGFFISMIFSYFLYRKTIKDKLTNSVKDPKAFSWSALREAFAFSLPLIPLAFSSKLMQFGDRFFLLNFLGPEEVALYSIASSMIAIIIGATSAIFDIMRSRLFGAKNDMLSNQIAIRTATLMFYFASPIVVLIIVFGESIIMMLSSVQYQSASNIVLFLIPQIYISITISIFCSLLERKNRTSVIGSWYAVGLFFYMVFNYVLIMDYGKVGAALAGTISSTVILIGLAMNIDKSNYPWKKLLLDTFINFLLISVALLIKFIFIHSIIYQLIITFVLVLISLLMAFKTLLSLRDE